MPNWNSGRITADHINNIIVHFVYIFNFTTKKLCKESSIIWLKLQRAHWIQNPLIINSWTHSMKGGREFRRMGIKEGGERVTNVTKNKT